MSRCTAGPPHEDWETFVKMTVRGLEGRDPSRTPSSTTGPTSGGACRSIAATQRYTFRQRAPHDRRVVFDRRRADPPGAARPVECLLAFDRLSWEGLNEQLAEQRHWHDSQMEELNAWGRSPARGPARPISTRRLSRSAPAPRRPSASWRPVRQPPPRCPPFRTGCWSGRCASPAVLPQASHARRHEGGPDHRREAGSGHRKRRRLEV